MSLIALVMNLLLGGLLVAAMIVGIRLSKRLKGLRESHAGFEAAVRELNQAAARAEQGLADLRAATEEAADVLSDRIEKGRALAAKLERLVAAAPETTRAPERPPAALPPVMPPLRNDSSAQARLSNLIAMARSRMDAEIAGPPAAAVEPLVARTPRPSVRMAPAIDDDLFEEEPLNLDRQAGAGR